MYRENDIEFSRKWKVIKEKLKENFPKLTHEDLLFIEGRRGTMMVRIQQRLGKTQEEMYGIITRLEREITNPSTLN